MSTEQTPQLAHQVVRAFKIWYSDSTFDSTQGAWKEAPKDDVQVVIIYFEKNDALGRPTRLYSSGCDYYALDDEGNFTSHFDDIEKVKGHVLYGKFMNFEELLKKEKIAFNDYGMGWLVEVPKPKDLGTKG